MMDELDYDDGCDVCFFDEGIVRDEFHGLCPGCGFDLFSSALAIEALTLGR